MTRPGKVKNLSALKIKKYITGARGAVKKILTNWIILLIVNFGSIFSKFPDFFLEIPKFPDFSENLEFPNLISEFPDLEIYPVFPDRWQP